MSKYTAAQIKNWDVDTETPSGRWIPARPINPTGIITRCRHALGVLTGRYDVLDWEVEALTVHSYVRAPVETTAEESLTAEQPEDESAATVRAERDALRAESAELRQRVKELEAQVLTAGAEALEKMAVEFGMKGKNEDAHHTALAYFDVADALRAALKDCHKEARRLRGEGEALTAHGYVKHQPKETRHD